MALTTLIVSLHRPGTPLYVIRESTSIYALESTVLKMALDLTSSKDEIKDVKELLLCLINPRNSEALALVSPILADYTRQRTGSEF